MHIHIISLKILNSLKLPDKVVLEHCILISKYFNQALPKTFKNWFTLAAASNIDNTRWSNIVFLKIHSHNTKLYGRDSVNICAIYSWNYLWNLHVKILFYNLPLRIRLKNAITNSLILCTMHLCNFGFFITKVVMFSTLSGFAIYLFRVISPV